MGRDTQREVDDPSAPPTSPPPLILHYLTQSMITGTIFSLDTIAYPFGEGDIITTIKRVETKYLSHARDVCLLHYRFPNKQDK